MSAPRTLEEKQDEQNRLAKAYRAWKREQWAELTTQEPRLVEFKKALKSMRDPQQVLAFVAESWVRHAPEPIRRAALRLIDAHSNREKRFAGRPIFDDPLPPETNVFFTVKGMLALR